MKIKWLVMGTVFVLAGCVGLSKSGPSGTTDFNKEGWRPFSSVRTGDAPGRIYRVAPSGEVFEVTQVTLSPRKDNHHLYEVSKMSEFTLGEILETIGVAAEVIPIKVRSNLERKSQIYTQSLEAEREFLEDRDITDEAVASALAGIKIRDDNRYYLIRETLSSRNLNFKIDKSWLADLEVAADIEKVVKSNTNVKWTDGDQISLNKEFDEAYRIWYKPERLSIKGSLGMGPNQPPTIKRIPNAVEFKLPKKVQKAP